MPDLCVDRGVALSEPPRGVGNALALEIDRDEGLRVRSRKPAEDSAQVVRRLEPAVAALGGRVRPLAAEPLAEAYARAPLPKLGERAVTRDDADEGLGCTDRDIEPAQARREEGDRRVLRAVLDVGVVDRQPEHGSRGAAGVDEQRDPACAPGLISARGLDRWD